MYPVRTDIIGPVFVDLPSSPVSPVAWAQEALFQVETQDLINPDDYDLIAYKHSAREGGSGLPFFDPPGAIVSNLSLRAMSHEMGHAIGLFHSSALYCEDSSGAVTGPVNLGDPGTSMTAIEKGDIFDTMGETGAWTYNQQKRGSKGWFDPGATVTVTAPGTSTTVDLYPIEALGSQVKVVRVPRVVGPFGIEQYIYVEFRHESTFDSINPSLPVANGTLIRLGPGYNQIGHTLLLDARPVSKMIDGLGGAIDAPFAPLQAAPFTPAVFVDSTTGTKIETVQVSVGGGLEFSYATVKVTPGNTLPCTYGIPATAINPGPLTVQLQQSGDASATFSVTLKNHDSVHCPPVWISGTFTGVPASWGTKALPGFERKLHGQEEATWSIDGFWPPMSLAGPTTVTLETRNTTTGHQELTTLLVNVVPAP